MQQSDVLFRIESNGNGSVLGIDGNYNPYLIHATSSDLQIRSIAEIGTIPARFYAVDDTTYLVHTYKSIYLDAGSPSVNLITIPF